MVKRRYLFGSLVAFAILVLGACLSMAVEQANTARSGEVAVLEEFLAAGIADNVGQYRLFIARHPDHLAYGVAAARIKQLVGE